jgi:hypothetical protein
MRVLPLLLALNLSLGSLSFYALVIDRDAELKSSFHDKGDDDADADADADAVADAFSTLLIDMAR